MDRRKQTSGYCEECREWIRIVDGVTAIYDRGYWWCAKHVSVGVWEGGNPIVALASPGKLAPRTILIGGTEDGI